MSFQLTIYPISFSGVTVGTNPLAFAISEPHTVVTPEHAIGTDVSTPPVVNVVLELTFVDEVVAFSTQALHATIFVDLAKGALGVVLTDPQVEIDWAVGRRISNDVFRVQDSQLLPLLQALGKGFPIVQCGNQSRIVLWLCFELVNQFLGQVRSRVRPER